jgi:hypothetical protein
VNAYWINVGAPNADFWAHEFSKHATCTSTFDIACYGPSYKKHQDVINYFDAVIRAFHQYPTFDMLAASVDSAAYDGALTFILQRWYRTFEQDGVPFGQIPQRAPVTNRSRTVLRLPKQRDRTDRGVVL